jgi:putative glutamine amidotransferase
VHPPAGKVRLPKPEVFVGEWVIRRIRDAGGVAVLLPPGDVAGGVAFLSLVDGVVVTGGAFDIHPRHYGQHVAARLDRVDDERTDMELEICRVAHARSLPLLGLCGGMQALVVALGGTLIQHVEGHEQANDPSEAAHALIPEAGAPSALREALGGDSNSTHHQAVGALVGLAVLARAPDGVIEAVYAPDRRFCVGVQGHPELRDGRLFAVLIDHAAR